MKHNYNYQVWELNNGGLVLLVYENEKLVYANSGYEYNRGILVSDLECLESPICDVSEWEDNIVSGMTPDEIALITGPTSTLIAEDGRIYPEDMGPNGRTEFLVGERISFMFEGRRHANIKPEDLQDYLKALGATDCDTLYDVEINDFPAGDMYAGLLETLV